MEGMNLVDVTSISILFVSSVLAYFRGLSREVFAIISWITAALIAFIIAPQLNPLINKVPIIKEILMDSCQLSIIIAYIVSFIISLIILSLIVPMITNIIHQSNLSGLDRLLGLCFGALRGFLIIIALTIVYDLFFIGGESIGQVESSQTKQITAEIKDDVKTFMPNSKPKWIVNRFDSLMIICTSTSSSGLSG